MMIMTLVGTTSAFADGPNVIATANLGSGTLSATASVVDTSGFVLNGTDQVYSYTLPVAVTDASGSSLGWNLTITSTQFSTTGGTVHHLDANASTVDAAPAITSGSGTLPVAGLSNGSYPMTINTTATKFFSATAGTGMGSSTITPTIHVAVPANTVAGSYTSTITVASVSGP